METEVKFIQIKQSFARIKKIFIRNIFLIQLLVLVCSIYVTKTADWIFSMIIIQAIWNLVLLTKFKMTKYIIIFNIMFIFIFVFCFWSGNNLGDIINKKFVVVQSKTNYAIMKSGNLNVYVSTFNHQLSVGEYYYLSGDVMKITSGSMPWEFDFNSYLMDQNIKWKLADNGSVVDLSQHNFRYSFYQWLSGRTDFEKNVFGQLKTGDGYENLIAMSLSYLFNISFLNFIVFEFLIRKFIKSKRNQTIVRVTIAQIFLPFIILENAPIAILKVYLLVMVNSFFFIIRKNVKRQIRFSIVWMTELIINPWYIFNIGFIYVSLCFLLLKRFQENKLWINIAKNLLISYLIFIPVQAFYDYKIFWTSSFYQLLMTPIIAIVFLLSIPALVFPCGGYQFLLNNIINHTTTAFVKISLTTIVGHFSIFLLIFYYIFLKLFIVIDFKKIRYAFLTGSAVLFLSSSFYNTMTYRDSITMINVGDGNSFVAKLNHRIYLFDAGGGYGLSKEKVKDYLVYYGVRNVERIFLSHGDDDHVNQVEAVTKAIHVKNITKGWENFQHTITDDGIVFTSFVYLGHEDENSNSMVTYFQYHNQSFLFTGDATNEILITLTENQEFRNLVGGGIDFYQVPHHGSNTSDNLAFMQLIQPKNAFISCRYQKSRPFPRPSVVENLKLAGLKNMYITGRNHSWRYLVGSKTTIDL